MGFLKVSLIIVVASVAFVWIFFNGNVRSSVFHSIGQVQLMFQEHSVEDCRSFELKVAMNLMHTLKEPIPKDDAQALRDFSNGNVDAAWNRSPYGLGTAVPRYNARVVETSDPGVKSIWVNGAGVKDDSKRVLLYIHGGGMVVGSPHWYKPYLARISRQTGARVLALDYGLSPEHSLPEMVAQIVKAYQWLIKKGYNRNNIIISGDSAGGGLSLLSLQSMVENNVGVPAGAVLISPFSDLSRSLPAHVRNRDKDVLLSPELMDTFSKHIKSANKLPLAHPSMSPLFASFDDLPPLLFTVSETEVLADDSYECVKKAEANGVEVTVVSHPNSIHIWPCFNFAESIESSAIIANWMNAKFQD